MKGSQEKKFLSANLSTKNPVARFLKLIDDKPQMPPECNDVIMDGLSVITKQALQNGQLGREDMEKLSIVLKTVSLLASYEEEPKGLTQLLDKGLIQMILDILVATLSVKDCANSGIDQFLEDILEVIGPLFSGPRRPLPGNY
ncbi:hypothetical protein LSAT2_031198 [Lamellibrachia satsuma]|nr:hypothetical protein LSAT2_031198 [Lamellibrachia satsuma]